MFDLQECDRVFVGRRAMVKRLLYTIAFTIGEVRSHFPGDGRLRSDSPWKNTD
ncbi:MULTISPECIES: hypothetical protein [unclassified Microcoleus]|uniref:hypothetical protein n=1 Tax=unclassified Microcoleus TaxID=2642155 RepID=UPI002FCEAB0D